jgi:hypothetical protein
MKVLIHTSSATSTKFQEKGKKKREAKSVQKSSIQLIFL